MDLSDRIIEEANTLIDSNEDTVALALLERIASASLNMLGMLYLKKGYRVETALENMKLACEIEKGNYLLRSNLSHIYNTLEMHETAAEVGIVASNMCEFSDHAVLFNTAIVMNNCQRLEESINFYRLSLAAFPSLDNFRGSEKKAMEEKLAQIRYNYGTTNMANGNFKEGWPYYESRLIAYEKPAKFAARFKSPAWKGQDLTGKKLIIFSEQGIGDLFQFSRYIDRFKHTKAKIVLEAQKDAAEIISKSFPYIDVISRGHENYAEPPESDYSVSICSLPLLFGCDDISKIDGKPYLVADNRNPPEVIAKSKNLKVGLAWAGNPGHAHDFMRSCPLNRFKPLMDIPGVDFFSFQKDLYPTRVWKGNLVNIHDGLDQMPINDITSFLNTFSDTAVCLNNIDLMITIDSATAHLAGALGCPVWMLIPFINDWRWMKDRTDTKWYNSMKIYRQPKLYEWEVLIQQIKEDLSLLAANKANLS